MVGFSEKAIDNDCFPDLDDFTLLIQQFVTAQATGGFLGKFMLQLYDRML